MAVRLIIEDLEGATTVVNLGNEDVTIGRKPHNTIQLTEQNVSRSHAKLIFQADGWLVHDLSSYNGIKVNGVAINGPTIVRESDLIQIGDYHLTLTDDVDRATVDIERPRAAANDFGNEFGGGVAGAVSGQIGGGATGGGGGAAASSELPSVSVEDLPPMRPPNLGPGDSAPYRTDSVTGAGAGTDTGDDQPQKSKVGVFLAIVGIIVVLSGVVGIAIWTNGSGDDKDTLAAKTDEQTDSAAEVKPVAASDDSGQDSDSDSDSGQVPTDGGADSGLVMDDGEIVETDTETETGEPNDAYEIVETDGGDEPAGAPKPKPKPKSRPKPPPAPKLPPDQALAEARKASLKGDNRKAYSLAKDAYDQNKSSEALSVMGIAACKMGSASKAKSVYRKMSAAKDKQTLEKICQPLGVELQ